MLNIGWIKLHLSNATVFVKMNALIYITVEQNSLKKIIANSFNQINPCTELYN